MKIIVLACSILFFAACNKEIQKIADVNLNIYGPNLQSFTYKIKINGTQTDSSFVQIGGYLRHWFGSRANNTTYGVFFTKVQKYDTGYVDIIWRNGDKEIIKSSRLYLDTINFNFENEVKY